VPGNTFGRQLLDTVGRSPQVSADGRPKMKAGGVTVDWDNTVAAVGAPVTYEDGIVVNVGEKVLRYGQVLTKITLQPAQTITVTGAPTGGSFNVTGTRPDTGVATTQTIAFNAAVAAVQTAMDAIFGPGNTLVTAAGALPANAQTVTFQGALIGYAVAPMTAVGAFTGGTAPAVAIATVVGGGTNGWFGPYDPAAADGRQTLVRGNCFIMNETVKQEYLHSNHPPVLDGGRVFKARLLQAGTGAASLAAGPTLAAFEAAFPQISYATN
jgi:hypothetical protein